MIRYFLALAFLITSLHAETVDEIVDKTNKVAYYQGDDGRADIEMKIFYPGGQKRERKMKILRRNGKRGDQKFYLFFEYPKDISKQAFLVWKYTTKDDDRWLYLPALGLINRISSSDKRTSFAGANFFYEDVSGRNTNDDEHELLETDENFYVMKHTPKNKSAVEFSYYKMWILRKNYLVTQIIYYDKSGKEYRQYNLLKWDMVQGMPTPKLTRMKDLRSGGYTEIEYKNVKYNLGVPESIFTERFLRRPPYRYLK